MPTLPSDLPLVSLITPSYNQAEFLEASLQSALNQTYPRLEYIVMDGGSTDGSAGIIARAAARHPGRLAHWESQPDRGQAHAINKGLERATGDLLGWLNSDDVLLPDTVERVVQVFRQRPDVDVVYGRLERIDASGAPIPTPNLPKDRVTMDKAHVIGECIVNQPGSFWRRRIMQRVGLLDERLRYNMDYEYWIRMALAGAIFLRLDEPVACFRLSAGSKTVGQTAAMAVEQLGVLEQLLARPDLPAQLGQTPARVSRQAKTARSVIGLHALYGSLKLRRWSQAAGWLGYVLRRNPALLLDRRWRDLALAGLQRRLARRSER